MDQFIIVKASRLSDCLRDYYVYPGEKAPIR